MFEVGMCLKGYPALSLGLYAIPSICEPINSQPLNASHSSTHPHLIGLELGKYCAHQMMQFYDFYRMIFKE